MDTKKYEAFLCAVETGSFTAAAEKLHFTPAGISHMVDALEQSLGLVLLNRGKHGVTLTNSGEMCIEQIRSIVRAETLLLEHTAQILGLFKGTVTVGAYYSVSSHLLPRVFRRFLEDYPDVHIELREGGHNVLDRWMSESELDFCIYSFDSELGYEWHPLCRDEMVVAVPEDHPFAGLQGISLEQCRNEKWIIPAMGNDYDLVRVFGSRLSELKVRFTTVENYSTIAMVEQGLGISLMNRLITRGLDFRVRYIPLDPAEYITFGIAVPSLKNASPAARMMIRYIREMLSES